MKWLISRFPFRRRHKATHETKTLELDLVEKQKLIAQFHSVLELQHRQSDLQMDSMVQAQLERILSDIALPLSQLHTQAYILEVEGRPVKVEDVIAVSKHLIQSLEDIGLKLEPRAGETTAFDPNFHTPLSTADPIDRGQPVTIRFPGVMYRNKLIRKASIESRREP
jgi:molecular chaperone GrpE (heat shock protein)